MKKMKTRILSAGLALCMLVGMLPSTVFAVGKNSLTVTAQTGENLNSNNWSEEITKSDNGNIKVYVQSTNAQTTGATYDLDITIPYGLELCSGPGFDSITNGKLHVQDYVGDNEMYFSDEPSWTRNKVLKGNPSGDTYANESGILTYTLNNVDAANFTFIVKVNPLFVPVNATELSTLLGEIKVDLNENDTTVASDEVPVTVVADPINLKFDSFAAYEYASLSLDHLTYGSSKTIMVNHTDSVKLSTVISTDPTFEGVSIKRVANGKITFDLKVPEGATLTYPKIPISGTKQDETDDSYDIYTINVSTSGTFSELTNCKVALDKFVTVQIPDNLIVAGETFEFEVMNPKMELRDVYDVKNNKFANVTFESESSKTDVISVVEDVEDTDTDYVLTLGLANKTAKNIYAGSDYVAYDYSKLKDQVLFVSRRSFNGGISTKPVQIKLEAKTVGGVYLDQVNEMCMNIPFLGEVLRYSSVITGLEVVLEDTTADALTTETITYTSSDMATLMSGVAAYPNGMNGTGESNGLPIGENGLARYYWDTNITPQIIVRAPEGKSVVSITATFDSDNNSFIWKDTTVDTRVKGYPKDPMPSSTRSQYVYAVYQDANDDNEYEVTIKQTSPRGFNWEVPKSFDFTVSSSTSTLIYQYNTTVANTVGAVDRTYSLEGYQNLGAIALNNQTGSVGVQNITFTADIDTEHGDVVKQIFFPRYNDASKQSKVVALEYQLSDGTVYTLDGDDVATCSEGTFDGKHIFIVTAPDNVSFDSFTATIDGWGTATNSSMMGLRGHLADSKELNSGDVKDEHKLTISYGEKTIERTVDSILKAPITMAAATHIKGAVTTPVSDTNNEKCNVLTPGSQTDIEFALYGGKFRTMENSWHGIEFTVVLPSAVTLDTIAADDFYVEFIKGNATPVKWNISNEVLSDLEEISAESVTDESALDAYYGVDASDVYGIDEVVVYKYRLSDPDDNLYWARHTSGDYDTHSRFTVNMTLDTATTATSALIPWNKVLIMGTSAVECDNMIVTAANNTANVDRYQGEIANVTGAFATGVANNVVTGPSDVYMYVDAEPKLIVHHASVTMGDEEYRYDAEDEESVAVFGEGEKGTIHFDLLDTIDNQYSGVNYVLIPIPTATQTNALQTDADFKVDVNEISFTGEFASCANYKYATIDDDTTYTAQALTDLYTNGSAAADGYNAIIIQVDGQEQYSTIGVDIDFTVPDTITSRTQYIELSAMSAYYFNESARALYYGGAGMGNNPDAGNDFIRFGYYFPEHTVSFENTTKKDVDVKHGYTIASSDLDAPEKLGYTFVGWYTNAGLTASFNEDTFITRDMTLYAKYTEKTYTVTFAYEDGYQDKATKIPDAVNVEWNGTIALPTKNDVDVRAGYEFLGWYVAGDEDQTKLTTRPTYSTLDKTAAGNLILIALYENNGYGVTYELCYEGGTAPDPDTFKWDKAYTLPTVTREGYTFAGWYTTETNGEKVPQTGIYGTTAFTDAENADQHVYARWTANEYRVGYDLNGGTWVGATEIPFDVSWDEVLGALPEPEMDGYDFAGWKFGNTLVAADSIYGDDIGVTEDADGDGIHAKITATWTEKEDYTLTFMSNGSVYDTTTIAWSDDVTLPVQPTRDGYTFNGWFTTETGGEKVTSSTEYQSLTGAAEGTAKVYAQWIIISYTIGFDHDEDGVADTTLTVYWDTVITDATGYPVLENTADKTFLHWNLDTSSTEHYPITNQTYGDLVEELKSAGLPTNNIILTPHFDDRYVYVVYHTDFGTAPESDKFGMNGTVSVSDLNVDGYTFDGWYTAETDGIKLVNGSAFETVFGNGLNSGDTVHLYARHTRITYVITYIVDGVSATKTVNWGDTVGLTAPVKAGYTFECWCTDEAKTTKFDDLTEIKANITLYAKFNENAYTVIYDMGYEGAIAPENGSFKWNASYMLADVSRTGYTFLGWYTAKTDGDLIANSGIYGTAEPFADETDMDVVVYAKWAPVNYTVGYDLKNGSWSDSAPENILIAWNGTFGEIKSPVRAGYTFDGWFYENSKIETGDVYSEAIGVSAKAESGADVVLTAKWSEITDYTLEFDDQIAGNGINHTETIAWTGKIGAFPTVERAGYTLDGWFTAATGGTKVETTTAYNTLAGAAEDNAVVYAQWTAIQYTIHIDTNGDGEYNHTELLGWNDVIVLPESDPTKVGETFLHWDLVTVADNTHYPIDPSWTVADLIALNDGNTDIYIAPHFGINNHMIHLESDVGTPQADFEIDANDPVNLGDLVVDGYTFDGWYTAETGGIKLVNGSIFTDVFGDVADDEAVTLYARHIKNKYVITYDLGNDVDDTDTNATMDEDVTVNVHWDDTVTLPTPTKTGYVFTGWFEQADGKTDKVSDGAYHDIYGSDFATADEAERATFHGTLYAGWEAEEYTVTYILNYAEASHDDKPATVKLGWDDEYIAPAVPVREGYIFGGWATVADSISAQVDKTYTNGSDYSEVIGSDDKLDVHLYAIWTSGEYTVEYNSNGGSVVTGTMMNWHDKIVHPADPSKLGYNFGGWYSSESLHNAYKVATNLMKYSELAVDSNDVVTLYAKWNEKTFCLVYQLDGGHFEDDSVKDTVYGWEDSIGALAIPVKNGYTFKGWYCNGTKVEADDVYSALAAGDDSLSIVLKAHWSKDQDDVYIPVTPVVPDIEDSSDVEKIDHIAYIYGYSDEIFAPESPLLRAEAVLIFTRLFGNTMDKTATYTSSFVDVDPSSCYANEVGYMEQIGAVDGCGDDTFCPLNPITRGEFIEMASYFFTSDELRDTEYTDVSSDHWGYRAIMAKEAEKWMKGYEDGTFRPGQYLTRAEAVVIYNRVCGRSCDEQYVETHLDELHQFTDVTTAHWAYLEIMEAANSHTGTKTGTDENWFAE